MVARYDSSKEVLKEIKGRRPVREIRERFLEKRLKEKHRCGEATDMVSPKPLAPTEDYPWFAEHKTASRILRVSGVLSFFAFLTFISFYPSFDYFAKGGNKEELLTALASESKTPVMEYLIRPAFVPVYYGVNLADLVYRATNNKQDKKS